MERSSSTIPQTHIFFVPNIKGLAQTVLTWEGKVFAVADAADADAAETDWKHKVTPERGDLIIRVPELQMSSSDLKIGHRCIGQGDMSCLHAAGTTPGGRCNMYAKRIVNWNLAKSRVPISYCSAKPFWNLAQSTILSPDHWCALCRFPWPWWRHQMETFSALLALCAGNSPVSGEFPSQRPVTRGFDVFFDLLPNKRLSRQ